MRYGLTCSELEEINAAFRLTPEIEKAVLFGSRAKGNYQPGSDIDLAVYGKGISFDDFLTLKVRLDDLKLMQKVDLVKYSSIENLDFIEHINRVGIIIYQKE